jgi:UDP-glucose 4-epimerase
MKYLVTGGAGFIGSHIIQYLLRGNHEVLCLDNFDPCYDIARKRSNISPFLHHENFELIEGDIRDEELLQKIAQDTEYIFHEAAQVSVVESMKNPIKTIEINTIGTLKVLSAAMKCNVKKIIIASSAAVYGDSPEIPKKENMLPAPKSLYAISKLDCEYLAKLFYEEYGLRTTTLRYFNVYGPRQDPTSPYAAAIPIFIRQALKNDNIVIFGDGSQTRDFIYVKDVVQANELVMSKGDGKILNVANASVISIIELARQIIELMGSSSKIVFKEPRTGDIRHSFADISDISEVGFKPKYDLKKGLNETIEWFKKNG